MADKKVVRQDVVQIGFDIQDNPIAKLNDEINKLKKAFGVLGDDGDDAFEKIKKSSKQTENPLEEQKKKLEDIKKKLTDIGKKAATTAFNGMKKLAGISFKALTVGITGAATAIVGLVSKATSAFANYQQLVGGVETLLGAKGAKNVQEYAELTGKSVSAVQKEYEKLKKSEDAVLKYANDAYKTAGISANTYMETVTSFSASLLQSLGGDTQKTADLADLALRDMSDNANKMGTDMGSIIDTYKSLSRGNFAMLDNLKLGYGGTKSEMQRLIKEASKLDKSVKSNDMSFGNIVKAIHAVQENMGILGTTEKEATTTISGSLGMVKASWENLLTAIGSGENLDQCFDNMIDAVEIFGDNIQPVLQRSLASIGIVIEKLVPKIAEKLPQLAEDLLPPLIKSAVELTKGLIKALPSIIKTLFTTIADICGDQFPVLKKIFDGIAKSAGSIAKLIPIIGGLILAFKGFNKVKGIFSLFGGGEGSKGKKRGKKGGLIGMFKSLAKMKPAEVLKGMANLAIILGGVTLLTTALMLVAPHIAKLSSMQDMGELLLMIVAVGAVGTALAKLSSIVGKIPVSSVAKGLANIAIAIGGLTAVYIVIGFVSKLPFNIQEVMQIIKTIGIIGVLGSVLAVFAGIVGLIPIPVVLLGLANIALVINGFALLLAEFAALNKIPGFLEFIKSGGEVLITMFNIMGKIAGSLIGGLAEGVSNALPAIGENLGKFGENVKPLFESMKGIDMGGVGKFFTALVALLGVAAGNEIVEGIKSFFGGDDESSLAKLGTELSTFAGNAKGFFNTVAKLPDDSFSKGTQLFKCLANVKDLPKPGKDGSTKLSAIASDLGSFHSTAGDFFTNVETYNLEKVNELWSSLAGADTLTSDTLKKVGQNIDEVVKKVSDLPNKMGDGLKKAGASLSTAMVEIWQDAVKATSKPVNKLIEGANWILKEFGSKKKIITWTPYAKGTGGHKGGNALVNDGRGAEMVQMPNGNTFIPRGRNVFLPNAPKGMKVLSAEHTAQVLGRRSPTFRYAKGTGDIDIWDYMDNAKGLVSRVSKKYVTYDGLKGVASHIGKSMVSTITGEMSSWAEKLYDEFGALSLADYNPSKGVGQWRSTVIRALKMEGLYSASNVARTLFQMQTESGGNPRAINLWDSNAKKGIPSKGLMQVIDPTFSAYARPGFNKNIYDPLSNILASVRYATSRYGSLSKAYRGVGYSKGVGKVALPQQSGTFDMSYTPDNSYSGGRAVITENNSYSPVFNLTINGSVDDRATERKIKQWISEAMDDVFESMARKSPRLREV